MLKLCNMYIIILLKKYRLLKISPKKLLSISYI
nr:MAG TPA: hypothetical protein [Caudoviricetes sp.]